MHDIEKLIREIPKCELHLHIEGCLEPEMMFQLAERNGISLPFADPEQIRQAYKFTSLQSFLNIYYQGTKVLCTELDFYDLTWAYLQRAKRDQVYHTEFFFDPQSHTQRGVPFATVINGIHRAQRAAEEKLGITSKLILCFLRHLSEQDALEILKQALPYKKWIVAVGLDSSEKDNPPEKFQRVFDLARKERFLAVAHAGEEGPPDYIWQALNLLKVKRIDHGIKSIEDNALFKFLKEEQIPLTICPLSNVKLKVINQMKYHTLKTLLHEGLCVTVNSDDPAYFGGYIVDNYISCYRALDLSAEDIVHLAKNSVIASFLSNDKKAEILGLIESKKLEFEANQKISH